MARIETDYETLAGMLEEAGSPLSLAEIHGGLCGVICAGGQPAAASWVHELLDDANDSPASRSLAAQALEALADESWRSLTGPSMEFVPLLPDDDTELGRRAEALGHWCHGFLAGLLIGGVDLGAESGVLSDDARELVEDFARISKAGAETDAAPEGEETEDRAWVELVEYVRIGAQYVFEELLRDQTERTVH